MLTPRYILNIEFICWIDMFLTIQQLEDKEQENQEPLTT